MPELAPWLDIVAEANGISFFNWHVRQDRLAWNPGAEERMGLPAGALGSLGQWYRCIAPGDAGRVLAVATRLFCDQAPIVQLQYRQKRSGGRSRIMEVIGHCAYDRHGQPERVLGAVRDITDTVETARDLRHLRGQFLRRARLDALGAVAAGLAHELNQPLSAAANYLGALRMEAASTCDATTLANADRAADQIDLAGDIIRRLRTFLAGEDRMPEWLSVEELIGEAVALALPGSCRSADLSLDVARGLRIFGDRVQIQQVLVNLLHNAMGAMADLPRAERRISVHAARRKRGVELSVSDTGPGFSAETLKRFHLRFASSSHAQGMGIGLSICRHIMEEQGGEVAVGNGPGGGASVRLLFPDFAIEECA